MLRRLRIDNLVLIREADLELGPGLVAITGETGAGKTIFTQAIGLLLGARGDDALVGPAGAEAYVEAELDLPDGALDGDELEPLRDLRPEDEPGVVLARRVFPDGRSRAYAWGRSVPREAVAALAERLVAMSGQFEQRRLARPAHQLDLLDAFAGEEQLRRRAETARAWRELTAARRALEQVEASGRDRESRLVELRALVDATAGMTPGREAELRAEREVLRRSAELVAAAAEAAEALAPEATDGDGAGGLAARAEAALGRVAGVSAELDAAAREIAVAAVGLREAASSLRGFLLSLDADPGRLDAIEDELARLADARRRFRAQDEEELLSLAEEAARELATLEAGGEPAEAARAAAEAAQARYEGLAAGLASARRAAAGPFAEAARAELKALGLGEGELVCELGERAPGPTGADEVTLLVRANAGLPLAPVATTASGGELSRIALALRLAAHARAGEQTVVFDEIDAGIGGTTAHAVAEALRRLSASAQVLVITHLPQLAIVADAHLRVEKVPGDPTHTRVAPLDEDARRAELERMLGGSDFLSSLR
ncbi:MAG: AAA family ATPase [Thermoleophilia bacterium]